MINLLNQTLYLLPLIHSNQSSLPIGFERIILYHFLEIQTPNHYFHTIIYFVNHLPNLFLFSFPHFGNSCSLIHRNLSNSFMNLLPISWNEANSVNLHPYFSYAIQSNHNYCNLTNLNFHYFQINYYLFNLLFYCYWSFIGYQFTRLFPFIHIHFNFILNLIHLLIFI